MLNEPALLELLATYGDVRVVEFDATSSLREQLEVMAGTGVFVSVHTSNLANAPLLRPGSAVVEIIQVWGVLLCLLWCVVVWVLGGAERACAGGAGDDGESAAHTHIYPPPTHTHPRPPTHPHTTYQRHWTWNRLDQSFREHTAALGDLHHYAWRANK